jgi:hypothetical protein
MILLLGKMSSLLSSHQKNNVDQMETLRLTRTVAWMVKIHNSCEINQSSEDKCYIDLSESAYNEGR